MAQLARLVWYSAIPLLLIVAGAWFLWLQVLARNS
jgi:hypothetical protein